MHRPDGYRYVQSYHTGGPHAEPWWNRWALWEIQDGRAKRVGTARSEDEYRSFLEESA